MGVHFDEDEVTTNAAADMTITNEANGAPGGIVGFKLEFWQVAC